MDAVRLSGSGAAIGGRYWYVLSDVSESTHDSSTDDAASSKWLEVGGEQAQRRWRLPDDASLEFLEAQIKAAMRSGEPLAVEVLSDTATLRRTVVLNGGAVPFVVLSVARAE